MPVVIACGSMLMMRVTVCCLIVWFVRLRRLPGWWSGMHPYHVSLRKPFLPGSLFGLADD